MILLSKSNKPEVLKSNADSWTKVLLDKEKRGEEPTQAEKNRYNHPDIKAALLLETKGKCAYCESKMRHVAFGDIEHVVPKSFATDKAFDWDNLTIACQVCNNSKRDFVGDHTTFVDPYIEDPERRFWHYGPTIYPMPGDEAAKITEKLLKLNRAELVEQRKERLASLVAHLEIIEKTQNPLLRSTLFEDFKRETTSDREFAAVAREFLKWAAGRLGYAV